MDRPKFTTFSFFPEFLLLQINMNFSFDKIKLNFSFDKINLNFFFHKINTLWKLGNVAELSDREVFRVRTFSTDFWIVCPRNCWKWPLFCRGFPHQPIEWSFCAVKSVFQWIWCIDTNNYIVLRQKTLRFLCPVFSFLFRDETSHLKCMAV